MRGFPRNSDRLAGSFLPVGLLAGHLLAGVVPGAAPTAGAADRPRARDLGVPFDGAPGPLNAITDVPGVEVGHSTIIFGHGERVVGSGPARTGVTAILPRGRSGEAPVYAGWFSLNGNGEMTGTAWIDESGLLSGPIMITNTHSVGVVRDAAIAWQVKRRPAVSDEEWWGLPVVAETWDGELNDINGFHVKPRHAFEAIDGARGGGVAEGNVGGGTGMICHEFKGGIGTASRRLASRAGGYTVGVLVQCNYGLRDQLLIAGVPVGREIPPEAGHAAHRGHDGGADRERLAVGAAAGGAPAMREVGSIIVVIATDAPLLPHQLKRVARRASLGLGRMGSFAGNGSGDLFIAFSTANPEAGKSTGLQRLSLWPNERLDPIFTATVEGTEEAIVNALVAAETMTGASGRTVIALPHDRLRDTLRRQGQLAE
jgi:L-aminopeptidase/D-esterase-like protein